MREVEKLRVDEDSRVREAVSQAMLLYLNKLDTQFYNVGLENGFQFYFAIELQNYLDTYTLHVGERFLVLLEQNMPINGNNDYVDIVIKYINGKTEKNYLIELKFKKKSDSAPDLGNIESYKDIFNLDSHRKNTKNVYGCYFIFLTDLNTYSSEPRSRGTRAELPMHDGYVIEKSKQYMVTGNSAIKNTKKYPNGFVFSKDFKIEYQNIKILKKDYWFFILEI